MDENLIKVLLVEDDDIDAEEVKRSFKKSRIMNPLVRAKDGQDALDLLRANDNQLVGEVVVLLDLNMPRMNGHEFLKEVRNDPELTKLPIFVITSSDEESDIDSAYKAHVSGYIIKPINKGEMVKVLENLNAYWAMIRVSPIRK